MTRHSKDPTGWRYLAVLMCAIQVITLVGLVYFWWAYSGNLSALKAAGDVCFPSGGLQFDSIKAAEMFGRLDVLTLVFALVAVILGLVALVGFRIFRREVLAEAASVAGSLIPDEVRRVVSENYPQPPEGDTGELFTPTDVPYDMVEPENDADALTGSAGLNPDAPEGGSGAGRAHRSRSWFRRFRNAVVAGYNVWKDRA